MGSSLEDRRLTYPSLPLQLQCSQDSANTWGSLGGSLQILTRATEQDRTQGKLVTPGEFGQVAGLVVVPQSFLPGNKERSMSGEAGTPPPTPAPFWGESSLCPCLDRVFPSFERSTFFRQIFKLKSSRTKAACQLWPSSPAPLPLQPGCHYCLMGEGCEGFRRNIWSGPLSAGETKTSQFPSDFLRLLEVSKPKRKWGEGGVTCTGTRLSGKPRPVAWPHSLPPFSFPGGRH